MLLFVLYKCLDYLWRTNKKLVVVIASGEGNEMSGVTIGGKLHFLVFSKTYLIISVYSLGFAPCAYIAYQN